MKISTIMAVSAFALTTSAMAAGSIWNPETAPGPDGYPTQTKDGGYIYGYDDTKEATPGASSYAWDLGVDEYGAPGISDNAIPATLTTGAGFTYPFAAIGFDMYKDQAGTVDFSSATGFCVTYSSDGALKFEVKSTAITDYDNYTIAMPSTGGAFKATDFPFASMKQGGWGAKVSIDQVKAAVGAIAFKLDAPAGKTVKISTKQVGLAGECTGGGVAVRTQEATASLKAVLSGRSMSFSGLGKKSMQVQVINLQGQVFNSSVLSASKSTLNLSSLTSGVYIVRAVGSDFNFSQKIVLE